MLHYDLLDPNRWGVPDGPGNGTNRPRALAPTRAFHTHQEPGELVMGSLLSWFIPRRPPRLLTKAMPAYIWEPNKTNHRANSSAMLGCSSGAQRQCWTEEGLLHPYLKKATQPWSCRPDCATDREPPDTSGHDPSEARVLRTVPIGRSTLKLRLQV